MHVAIPLYMDTIRHSWGKPEFTWGRVVAVHSFIRALSAADTSVRLTIFVPTAEDVGILRQTLMTELSGPVDVIPFAGISAHLHSHPIDVLHTLDPGMWFGAHIRNHLSSQPFVVTGVTLSMGNDHFLSWALRNSANGVGRNDCLVCVTAASQSVATSCHARLTSMQPDFSAPRTQVIPLGINVADFAGEQNTGRSAFGISDDEFVILSLARFNPMFKMDYWPLLNLLRMIRDSADIPVRLVLAGASDDGSYAQYMQSLAVEYGLQEIVTFVLDPDDDRKAALYANADVFLSLIDNVQESMGLTIVEAMAAGLPIVASDWNGYRSLVEHDVSGYLVPTKTLAPDDDWEAVLSIQQDLISHLLGAQATAVDLHAARDFLLHLAGDRALTNQMGLAGRELAGRYDWQHVISQYLELWADLREQQQNTAAPGARKMRSSAIGFISDFAYYPSSHLSERDRFLTSELGSEVLGGNIKLNPYGQLAEVLDFGLITYLLRTFETEHSLRHALERLPAELNVGPLRVAQNVLWLYKYGYLRSVAA